MIGAGTGIAPFRAFLQERRAIGARGRNWLFFGNQRRAASAAPGIMALGYWSASRPAIGEAPARLGAAE